MKASKTDSILFRSHRWQNSKKVTADVDELGVSNVRVTKFLGVLVDENLSWEDHCNYLLWQVFVS